MNVSNLHETENFQQKLSFICAKCFEIQGDLNFSITAINASSQLSVMVDPIYYGHCCACCNNSFENVNVNAFICIDTEIAEIISKLNKLGLYTKFSCAGHAFNKIESAYIAFDNKINSKIEECIMKYELPKYWYHAKYDMTSLRTLPYAIDPIYIDVNIGGPLQFNVNDYDNIITPSIKKHQYILDWSSEFKSFKEYQEFYINSMMNWINRIKITNLQNTPP